DRDDRRVAEDDNDVRDRACATVETQDEDAASATTLVPPTVAETAAPVDPAATAAPTTVAPITSLPTEVTFGFVRGPNWILATPAGEGAATALNGPMGGVVFTKTCDLETQ